MPGERLVGAVAEERLDEDLVGVLGVVVAAAQVDLLHLKSLVLLRRHKNSQEIKDERQVV